MSLIFPFYGGWFFCKPTFVYGISIAKRPSLTIIPDVHMHKAVSSNFRFAFVGSFPPKKCGDENRSLVGFQGEEGCCFISQWMTSHITFSILELPVQLLFHFVRIYGTPGFIFI